MASKIIKNADGTVRYVSDNSQNTYYTNNGQQVTIPTNKTAEIQAAQQRAKAQAAAAQTAAAQAAAQKNTAAAKPATQTAAAAAPAATQTAAAQNTGYNGLHGLSGNTANQIANYQQGYTPSDAVNQANAALQNVMAQKPQGYESKYSAALDSILQRIQNPEQFKYSFNGDELFKNYADVYTQKGKQASLDAMGQAAGLTGGYGNSYGQMVGNQQYQQYLMDLYGKGMDLYDRAYQRYLDDQNNIYNQYNVLAQQDNTDYGRYRDTYGDWENERSYYTNRADTAYDRDYGQYSDMLNYWTGMGQAENSDYWTGENFRENQRQFDADMAEKQREWDQEFNYTTKTETEKNAYDRCCAIIANGKMPSKALLKEAGLRESDAKKMIAEVPTAGGGGRGGSSKGEEFYLGGDGKYYKKDKSGKWVETTYEDFLSNSKNTMDTRYAEPQQAAQSAIDNVINSGMNLVQDYIKKYGRRDDGKMR